jgi:hypothetical protein
MAVDQVERRGSTAATTSYISRWFAAIRPGLSNLAQYFSRFFRSSDSAGDVKPAPTRVPHDELVEPAPPKTSAAVEKTVTVPPAASAKVHPAKADMVVRIALDQDEIERRRNLVRTLFNDYWRGAQEKPAAFSERLDQAENYLNERLAANGEIWRLDASTRALLGLPPRSKSADTENRAARI